MQADVTTLTFPSPSNERIFSSECVDWTDMAPYSTYSLILSLSKNSLNVSMMDRLV